MEVGDKFVWVDELDQTVDDEVLVYIGKDSGIHHFTLDGCGTEDWVGLEDGELDWIKPLEENTYE